MFKLMVGVVTSGIAVSAFAFNTRPPTIVVKIARLSIVYTIVLFII